MILGSFLRSEGLLKYLKSYLKKKRMIFCHLMTVKCNEFTKYLLAYTSHNTGKTTFFNHWENLENALGVLCYNL